MMIVAIVIGMPPCAIKSRALPKGLGRAIASFWPTLARYNDFGGTSRVSARISLRGTSIDQALHLQDGDLVELAQKGREDAFEKLYYRHLDKLYSLAYGIVGNQADARDVVQETFLKAFQRLPQLRRDGAILGYLCRTASNAAIDVLRARKTSQVVQLDDVKADTLPSDDLDPDGTLEANINQSALAAALMQLSEDHRVVIVLHHLEGCPVEEIAERLALPAGTVKSRLGRAREALRRRLLGKVFVE
jgi:RNA polymerase sigma-70 factor (ECF subfamily)